VSSFSGEHYIVLVDACRNNPFASKGADANKLSPEFAASFSYEEHNLGKEAYATIFATSLGGEAYQYRRANMGYFSWVLDQALSGAAYDPKGHLTLQGLLDYLQQNTPKLVKLYNPGREQVPYAVVGGYLADQLVLAIKPTEATPLPAIPTPTRTTAHCRINPKPWRWTTTGKVFIEIDDHLVGEVNVGRDQSGFDFVCSPGDHQYRVRSDMAVACTGSIVLETGKNSVDLVFSQTSPGPPDCSLAVASTPSTHQ
jgi:hypothetical protein